MLQGLFVLLSFQLLGETFARGLGLPAPGPVVGVILLVAALVLRDRFRPRSPDAGPAPVETAADGLLQHLGLLFVPAGVGVAQSYRALDGVLAPVAAALILSTVVTMLATVGVFRLVARRLERSSGE